MNWMLCLMSLARCSQHTVDVVFERTECADLPAHQGAPLYLLFTRKRVVDWQASMDWFF